jgi:hypothetical protein
MRFERHEQFFSYLLPVTGLQIQTYAKQLRPLAVKVLLRATPTAID